MPEAAAGTDSPSVSSAHSSIHHPHPNAEEDTSRASQPPKPQSNCFGVRVSVCVQPTRRRQRRGAPLLHRLSLSLSLSTRSRAPQHSRQLQLHQRSALHQRAPAPVPPPSLPLPSGCGATLSALLYCTSHSLSLSPKSMRRTNERTNSGVVCRCNVSLSVIVVIVVMHGTTSVRTRGGRGWPVCV